MPVESRQSANTFEKTVTRVVSANYLLYLPKGHDDAQEPWPLLMFLHGAGERGNDLERVKLHGPAKLIDQGREFPFVVVSPQCPENRGWDIEALDALLDEIVATRHIDENRVYLTGLSMGGFGTWALAIAHPDRFAALAPICGGGAPRLTRQIAHLPTWVFHGAKDETVPLKESENMVEALKGFGGNVKFTVYPEAGHDSWTEAYDNPELYEWFLTHRRGEVGFGGAA
jgi:predicted peptidase